MNPSILATVQRAELFAEALRRLANEPAAQPFRFSGTDVQTAMLQFFPPVNIREGDDSRAIAKPFARLLGGRWTVDGDKWECRDVTYPGLEDTKIVIHYVVPHVRAFVAVDLEDEPEAPQRDEPDYDAPKPLTAMENYLQNDEHQVR